MNYDVIIIGAGPGGIFSAYELMKKAPLWARKHGLMTQAEWSLLVVNHPKARQIVDKMVEIYLYDHFLQKIGKLPKEEE